MNTPLPPIGETLLSTFPELGPQGDAATPRAVLGIGAFGHDAAVALVDGKSGQVLHAVAEERLSNEKHDWHFPVGAINECCRFASDAGYRLSSAAVNFRADEFVTKTLFREIDRYVSDVDAAEAIRQHILVELPMREYLAVDPPNQSTTQMMTLFERLGIEPRVRIKLIKRMTWYWNWSVKYRRIARMISQFLQGLRVDFYNHHETHAASAYLNSGFESATVLVIDGQGEADTVTVYRGENGRLTRVSESGWPHSLGIFYLSATQHLGFSLGDEYKVMGMSAYGKPRYRRYLRDMISVDEGARLWLNETRYLESGDLGNHGHRVFQFTEAFRRVLPPKDPGQPFHQRHFDFAASVQELTEKTGVSLVERAIALTGIRNVALAGGVALNGLMNEAIRKRSGCDDIFVYPASADDGCAVGAAQLTVSNEVAMPKVRIRSCYFGHQVTESEIVQTLDDRKIVASRPESIHRQIAQAIADGKIVARCTGSAEFGPRALGNRSLLAHPGLATMKETLNARVKHREEFRPFAPACLSERVNEFFELNEESPFMLLIGRARRVTRRRAPSVVHADGTARVQTVSRSENEDFYKVIQHFDEITGLPIVINTSFNVNGEAIVDTAEDALESFGYMDVDYLALGDFWISKQENLSILPSLQSDEYLQLRKDRFRQKDLGPLTQLNIADFDETFQTCPEALERLIEDGVVAA